MKRLFSVLFTSLVCLQCYAAGYMTLENLFVKSSNPVVTSSNWMAPTFTKLYSSTATNTILPASITIAGALGSLSMGEVSSQPGFVFDFGGNNAGIHWDGSAMQISGPMIVDGDVTASGTVSGSSIVWNTTNVWAYTNVFYSLNNQNTTVDFSIPYGIATTAGDITFAATANTSDTNVQTAVIFVTNSSSPTVRTITNTINAHGQGVGLVTNMTVCTFIRYGNVFTNVTCLPLW